jgi:hypothetical protein
MILASIVTTAILDGTTKLPKTCPWEVHVLESG